MNNLEKMMEQFMEKAMEQMMMKTMENMFSSMLGTPQVANAEITEAPKSKALSLDEFMALEDNTQPATISTKEPLDFVVEKFRPRNARSYRYGLKYNQYTTKSVWTYNHLNIKKHYPEIKYSNGYYYADDMGYLKAFASQYQIIDTLTEEQTKEVKAYWDSKKTK